MEKELHLLRAAEATLQRVTVSGSENMDRLLGVILTLRALIDTFGKEASHAATHETSHAPEEADADGLCRS